MKAVIFKERKKIPSLIWRSLKWHLNYVCTKKATPMACGLYITNRCNFKCDFCNIWRKSGSATLSFEKAKKLVDNLSDLGCFYFSISGGEPLLVNYIFDFLSYVKKSNIKYVHMVTNGYFLDKDRAVKLKRSAIDELSISIDGKEEPHDRRRQVSGAYKKAIEAIENTKEFAPKVNIVLNAIFFPEDPFTCLHAVELAHKFDIYMKIQPLNQHPIFNKYNHSLISSRENLIEKKEDIKKVIAILRKDKYVVNSNTFFDNIYNFYFQREKLIFSHSDCIFGYHNLEVSENGNIFPCLEGMNWENGIKFDKDLKDILFSRGYSRLLKGLKKCKGCQNNYYICYYEPRIAFPLANFIRFYR